MLSSQLNPLVAFIGGFVTFFASCLLPLVPSYIAYLMGSVGLHDSVTARRKLLPTAVVFVLGFTLTFVAFGWGLSRFAAQLAPYRFWLEKAGGLILILMGLLLLGGGRWQWLQREWHLPDINRFFARWHYLHAFIFGVVFAAGWTPCVGPMLAVILLWSAHQNTTQEGLTLLVSFSAGLGIPFLLTALALEKVMPWWQRSQSITRWINRLAGAIILLNGVLLLTSQWQAIAMIINQSLELSRFTP